MLQLIGFNLFDVVVINLFQIENKHITPRKYTKKALMKIFILVKKINFRKSTKFSNKKSVCNIRSYNISKVYEYNLPLLKEQYLSENNG